MPYGIKKAGSGYKVYNRDTGREFSKHPLSHEEAKKQLAALHIHADDYNADKPVLDVGKSFKTADGGEEDTPETRLEWLIHILKMG